MAQRCAAVRFLEACGFVIHRRHSDHPAPGWHVSAWSGWFGHEELIALAIQFGFDPENFDRTAVTTFECTVEPRSLSGPLLRNAAWNSL